MTATDHGARVLAVENLQSYFHASISEALASQQVEVAEHTTHYVVNLLTLFARSDALFDAADEGPGLRPLALRLNDALEAASADERNFALQRLGDVSLFIAGFFADSLAHRLVDLDYYIHMGGNAYGSLSDNVRGTLRGRVYQPVFRELAAKFQRIVDVLNEVRDSTRGSDDHDVLRLYEIWVRTGSQRAERLLRRLGVTPIAPARTDFAH
ncbi:MAG: hypothetical protein JJU27_08870 [Gammaproteobacteria bacterium]|nr:hypothetical protein [Gammaproteobacteria bacterium]